MPHIPDLALQWFFHLTQSLREFDSLKTYTSISSGPLSLLLDSGGLYAEAIRITGTAGSTLTELAEVQQKLSGLFSDVEGELYDIGRSAAIDHQMAVLQDQIELTFQYIKKKKNTDFHFFIPKMIIFFSSNSHAFTLATKKVISF